VTNRLRAQQPEPDMKLTRENLHKLSTKADGFTKRQVEMLGFKWPPSKGWLSSLIGTEMSESFFNDVKAAGSKPKQPMKLTPERNREPDIREKLYALKGNLSMRLKQQGENADLRFAIQQIDQILSE
jgi:hypothetical protein